MAEPARVQSLPRSSGGRGVGAGRFALLALLGGLLLATAVVAWYGIADVARALTTAGPLLLWLAPYQLFPLLAATLAWRALFPRRPPPPLRATATATWIGISVNWLLPVAQIGGEIAKAIWLSRRAQRSGEIAATAVVDLTLQAVGQALIALIGVAILALYLERASVGALVAGFAVGLLLLLYVFYRLQRNGSLSRFLARQSRLLGRSAWSSVAASAADLERELDGIYRPGRIFRSVAWRLLSRLLLVFEVWLALGLMGYPVSWLEALMLESLGQTVRAAAFAIPGAYGVQEGGYALLVTLLGLPPELGIAVSLAKRLRELIVGVPALIVWQLSEGQSLLRWTAP